MNFNISKLDKNLKEILKILERKNKFKISEAGIEIEYIKTNTNNISAKLENKKLVIRAMAVPQFLKGLSEYLINSKNCNFEMKFEKIGMMIDNSRNAVTNIEYTKKIIEDMAFMGHNTLYLYMEDTYKLEANPYFGYLRGAYTNEQLKELDDYAYKFGIELVPCIQTLAHLNQFLYWEHIERNYADIDDILNISDEKVMYLVENMIANFSKCLRSKRIHLGMDEAYNLGRGRYLDKMGLREKPYIMLEHLNNLKKICDKYDMKPIIWDDMFFSNYSKLEKNDDNFKIPDGISLMYWDYYNSNKQHYIDRIDKRNKISDDILFAGGAWKWVGYTPHHSKTIMTLKASLNACIEKKIKEVLITSWSDDGAESPMFNMYLGAIYSSSVCYSTNFKKQIKFYTNLTYNELMCVENLDFVQNTDKDITPSKYLFYEDIFMSKFIVHNNLINMDLTKYYSKLSKKYSLIAKKYYSDELLYLYFDFYSKYAKVLQYKWDLSRNIYYAYKIKDKKLMSKEIVKIDKLLKLLPKMYESRKKLWLYENKRYGYEVLEQRFGGIYQRLTSAVNDIKMYILMDSPIDELDEIRLPMIPENENDDFISYNRAQRIVSASKMIW